MKNKKKVKAAEGRSKLRKNKTGEYIGVIFNAYCGLHSGDLIGSCVICRSGSCYEDYFQFSIGNNGWVCDECVRKHAPQLFDVKKRAWDFVKGEVEGEVRSVRGSLLENMEKVIIFAKRNIDASREGILSLMQDVIEEGAGRKPRRWGNPLKMTDDFMAFQKKSGY